MSKPESETSFEIEATVTRKGQTTVPAAIRRVMGIDKGSTLIFRSMKDGTVMLTPKTPESEESDPMLEPFLQLLGNDIAQHPQRLMPISTGLYDQMNDLVGDVDIDLDEALPDE